MPEKVARVCLFGVGGVELTSSPSAPPFETRALDCRCYPSDDALEVILARDRPDVIITIGNVEQFPKLYRSPAEVTRRWIHFPSAQDLTRLGEAAFYCFIDNCVRERTDLPPLVSVFTPTYRTGPRIERPYQSLRRQHYQNWEWIVVDDSDDDGRTFTELSALAHNDHRVGLFRSHRHTGVIGAVKRWACRLANGRILVELDHDDELLPHTLSDLVRAFEYFDGTCDERPLGGFAYTDFAEVQADGSPLRYGGEWAFGYGRYEWQTWGHQNYAVAIAPNINPKTIRHIVGVPNHVRAWRRDCYDALGGHGRHIHVADDYELLVRTFLHTRMIRVPRLGYVQWRNPPSSLQAGNTHQAWNREIQRLTRAFSQRYDDAIHARLLALGVDDFVWQAGLDTFSRLQEIPNPALESHCTLTLPL